ncbi:hypothetical protein D9601_09670 [Sphingomonas sp. MA1305]|uniref:hypothetical protein n=1 Tax=Sphingomonas sp. MA1305 TaxID=2479204 RepID=UPI0018DF15A2|nr:hypothetical protein [Sphingomonas sp. MA1305]MBI0475618.1 hypothetical protein [Sphingomonas sp. MA1305]
MSEFEPIVATRPRAPRAGLIIVLTLLAFVAGVGLTALAMKRISWLHGTPAAAPSPTPVEPTGFSPAQPLNANGEAPDATVLATREAALAAQLAALETRTATIGADAAAAGTQATRAEGLLVVAAARRALDRGTPLGYLEEQLRNRFGATQPKAVADVIAAGRQSATLESLRQGLEAIAPDIQTVSGGDWWTSLRQELGGLIVLRRADTPSSRPVERLSRARHFLDAGQVEAARAEVLRLPGARHAGNWLAAADRYIGARQALDRIETTALSVPAAPAVTPPAATAPAAAAPAEEPTTT